MAHKNLFCSLTVSPQPFDEGAGLLVRPERELESVTP